MGEDIDVVKSFDRLQIASSGAVSLDSLPIELKNIIFHYIVLDATKDELKKLRQSNRYFRDRADIYLFQRIHISANNLSLQRAQHVANNGHLNIHVREIIYHRGTWAGHKITRMMGGGLRPRDYGDFEEYMVRGALANLPRVSKCYTAFCEEVQGESSFNREMMWQLKMKFYCSQYPNLEKLSTLPPELDLDSEYLKRRCGLIQQSSTPNYFAPYEMFEPCGPQFKPKSLQMESVNGEDFAALISNVRGGLPALNLRFSALRELILSFSETVINLPITGTYDVFFQACSNLRFLSLDFTSFYASARVLTYAESFPQSLIKSILQQHYPLLTGLELKYPLMTETDFIAFLDRHKAVLRRIRIQRWPMPVNENGEPTGSIIRALWKMGRIRFLYPPSISCEEEFSNVRSGDGWQLCGPGARNAPHDPVSEALHAYMHDQGRGNFAFPFDIDQKTMESAVTGSQLQKLDETPSIIC